MEELNVSALDAIPEDEEGDTSSSLDPSCIDYSMVNSQSGRKTINTTQRRHKRYHDCSKSSSKGTISITASLMSQTELPHIDDILVENSSFTDIGLADFGNTRASLTRASLKRFKADIDASEGSRESYSSANGESDSILTCL